MFDLISHLKRQGEFSAKAFGPLNEAPRVAGVLDHIRKELIEVEADYTAGHNPLEEWIDVIILASDGAMRCGATPEEICAALLAKQIKNENRKWPDWRTADPNKAIEHVREGE